MSDRELTELRARLAMYESYDQIIQENVARSSQLLQQMAAFQQITGSSLPVIGEPVTDQHASRYRSLFAALLDEITELQVSAERVARRVQDALDELESGAAPGGTLVPLHPEPVRVPHVQSAIPQPAVPIPTPAQTPAVTVDDTVLAEAQPLPTGDSETVWIGDFDQVNDDIVHGRQIHQNAETFKTTIADLEALGEPWSAPEPVSRQPVKTTSRPEPIAVSTGPQTTTVIVQGVHQTTRAVALKKFLEVKPGVQSVDPREFAEGVLRLVVTADRALSVADVEGWQPGADASVLHSAPGIIEIVLPVATEGDQPMA